MAAEPLWLARPQQKSPDDGVKFLQRLGAGRLAEWPRLAELIAQHHTKHWTPENAQLGRIVSLADNYSSYERAPLADDEELRQLGVLAPRQQEGVSRQESIFWQARTIYSLPHAQYTQASELFPSTAFPSQQAPQLSAFHAVVAQFAAEATQLLAQVADLDHLLVGFTDLFGRYAAQVCSDKGHFPFDISLFDHLSTSAAIAASIYLYHAATGRWDEAALNDDATPRFLLIGADLSGIQRYLYEIAQIGEGGVAKRLRARSFYLSTLQSVIAYRLRLELTADLAEPLRVALPSNAVVINTGGRFLLLAPNLPEIWQRLAQLDHAINQWLRRETHGDLACYFTAVELAGRDFVPEAKARRTQPAAVEPAAEAADEDEQQPAFSSITRVIDEVYQRLNQAKERRYWSQLAGPAGWQETLVQRTGPVEYPAGDGVGDGGACRSCRKLPVATGGGSTPRLCRRCAQDLELGRRLLDARYLAYRQGAPAATTAAVDLHFFDAEHRYTVRVAAEPAPLAGFAPGLVEVLALDPACTPADEYGTYLDNTGAVARQFPLRRRYLAGYVPHGDNGDILTFDALAALSGRPALAGAVEPLLGVLRMDVDQLGILVATGLGARTSISRVATFSRMLDLFFSGWVDTRLRAAQELSPQAGVASPSQPNPHHSVYTVYAGGDDLMLVGPWDQVVLTAQTLQDDFRRYTAYNQNVTLSAGVAVVKPGFPIAKSAAQAGKYLDDDAKGAGRNRLHLFGVTAPWYARKQVTPGRDARDQELRDRLAVDRGAGLITVRDLWQGWAEFFDEQLFQYREARKTEQPYPVSNILLHRVLALSSAAQRLTGARQAATVEDLMYMARLAYLLGRNVRPERYSDDPALQAVAQTVQKKLMLLTRYDQLALMAQMRMPLTWALYRNRERSER